MSGEIPILWQPAHSDKHNSIGTKSSGCYHSETRKFFKQTPLPTPPKKKSRCQSCGGRHHRFTCDVVDFAVHTGKVCDAQAQHAGLGPQVPLLGAVATVALCTEPSLRRFTVHLESPAQAHKRRSNLWPRESHEVNGDKSVQSNPPIYMDLNILHMYHMH